MDKQREALGAAYDYISKGAISLTEAKAVLQLIETALASQQAGEAVAWGVIDQNGQLRKNQFTTDKAVADQWLDKSAGNLLRLAPLVHPSIAEPQQQ